MARNISVDKDVILPLSKDNIIKVPGKTSSAVPPFVRGDVYMYCTLAADPTVTITEYRVLAYLFGHMDSYNVTQQSLAQIQEALGITQAALSRNVQTLCDRGWVARCQYRGRSYQLMVNPEMARRCQENALPTLHKVWEDVLATQAKRSQGKAPDDVARATQTLRNNGKSIRQKTKTATIGGVDARDRQSKKKPDMVAR